MAKYVKGLNKDAAPVDQPEGTYRYAKNALSNETAGAISNEPGTRRSGSLNPNSVILGTIEITDDRVVMFEVGEDGRSRILLYNGASESIQNVVLKTTSGNAPGGNDFDLKFNKLYPIEGTYKIDPDNNLIIYWTDNFNPPRSLNVTRQIATNNSNRIYGVNPAPSPNKNYIDRINLFPHAGPVPRIQFNGIASGGALKSGVYYLFLAYTDKDFVQTNYVSYSLAVPIVEDTESTLPIERYDGAPAETQTGKSIVWEVSNLNTDYDFLQPVVVSRIGGVENAYKLNQVDIPTDGVQTVTFSMLEGFEATSVEDTIIDTVSYDTAKTITQLDSVLYLGNLSGSRDIGYQKHANFIKLSTVTHEFTPFDPYEISSDNLMFGYLGDNPFEADKEKGYRGMFNLAGANNRKGYMRDEVYAFYIAFVLNDGTMSYAYHIPGREAFTGRTGTDVRKVGNDGVMPATVDELDFITEDIDSDINTLTQGSGQLFQFYCFSIFGNRDTNFWQNANEFYPNTDDYKVFNGLVEEDPIQGSNVRHHRMPSNASKPFITSNSDDFQPSTETETITYYFYWGDLPEDLGQEADNLLLGDFSNNTSAINETGGAGWNDWENGSEELQDAFGPISGWEYSVPNQSSVGTEGYFLWHDPFSTIFDPGNSGGTTATITEIQDNGVRINQTAGTGGVFSDVDQLNQSPNDVYGYFVWEETVEAVQASGAIEQTVEALGVKLDDIKIPKEIADKVQGFRIYYAERDHANRRILGQDVIKRVPGLPNVNLGMCDTAGDSSAQEDFLLSPGVIEHGGASRTTREVTFHDFYLLDGEGTGEAGGQRKSLVPGTHTTHEFDIQFLSFRGPGHDYYDLDDDECQAVDSYSSFHIGRNFSQVLGRVGDGNQFMHFPIREKCKTYLNGDSIYDGRALGFGKRIYNLGGESSILLGYKPNRTPSIPQFLDASPGGGAFWHATVGAGLSISYGSNSNANFDDIARLQVHNFQAYKTDMYLSYDTQELIWTGYEVLGEELENYTLKEDGTPTGGANFTTDDIYGGDTFICRHGYRITHRPEYGGATARDHKSLIYTMCESTDNINFRHETDADSSYFPASPVKKMLDQRANVDYTDVDNMHYNRDYSLGVADIKPVIPYPLRDANPTIFETRVQRSAKEDNTSIRDNYRVHLALQFKDLPRDRGSLWKLISLNNLLFLHTEDSLFRTKGKQSMKLSDGSESFVGSGDIFTQDPDEVIQTKFGYGGTQSQWVSLVTKHGYFCLDYRNRRVFMFKDNLYDIGKTGLESWFQDNIPYALEQYGLPSGFDNPIAGIGFTSMYDERYDRIILTKRDRKPTQAFLDLYAAGQEIQEVNNFNTTVQWVDELNSFAIAVQAHPSIGGFLYTPIKFDDTDYFTKDGWTVSYDVELNVWVSFHDYIPYTYSRSQDNLMSFSDAIPARSIEIHDDEINRGRFYGALYPFEFEFIYNLGKDQDKVFYSFNYMIDVSKEGALLHDQGFTSFYVYTTHQISDEQNIEYMINTRRIGNEWKINKFRDLALLQDTAVGPFAGSNFGVPGASVAGTTLTSVETTTTNTMFNIDGMNETINNSFIDATKSWNKQRKFSDKWVGIRLKYSNSKKNLINLYSTNVAAKKILQIIMTKLKRKTLKKVSKQLAKASKLHAGQSKKISNLANMMEDGGIKPSTIAMSSDTIQGLSSDQNAAKIKFERNIKKEGLNPFSSSVKSNTTISKDSDGNFIYRYITPTEKKHGGVHSDSKDFMKRMGYYQAGGLNQTPMYGANTMPGTPETAQLTYQEADQAKLDALDEQLKEQQESTAFMDEAKANTDAQAAKIAKAEQGLSMGIKGLDKLGVFDKLKEKGAKKVADKLIQKGGEEVLKKGVTSAATGLNPAQYGNIGAVASLAGEGIKMASDDQDATTMNFGETSGSTLSGIGTGIGAATTTAMLMGSTLGPVGMAAGAIGGALYGAGKGLIQRNKARREEDKAEKKQELALNKIKTKQKVEGLKDREYSGYDMGQNLAMYGGMKQYQAGGVALPGGTMEPIPGSDAVVFKGATHDDGGILVDAQTEVEGGGFAPDGTPLEGETMDKVNMAKKGGLKDYFFSDHLKLGGKSFAQRHKDILQNGGSQKNIDQLAKLQEEKAGRDPNAVKLGAGGYSQHQKGGEFMDFTQTSYNTDLNQDDIDDFTQGVTTRTQYFPGTTIPIEQPPVVEDENKPKPTNTTNTTNTKPKPKEREKVNYEAIPMKTITELPTDMYNNNSLPGILPYTDGTYPNVSDEIQKDLTLEEQNLIDKANSDRELTDAEERALRKIYKAVPNEALVAAGAQLIPAIYALSRKDAPAEQMSAPGRLKGPQLDRVSYNQERSQNAADSRSVGRFIEQSGVGPAGIIAKMSSYRRKQEGDMKIAAQESRANIAIANQEAQMQQQAEARNIANRLQVDQVNTAAREAERVAQINRKQEAIDVLGQGIAGTAGDVMSYKANERLAMATGDMGIYERDRLRTFLKGQINPGTGKPYTNSDIAAIFNKQFKDPIATKEVKEDKEDK